MPLLGKPAIAVADSGIYMIPQIPLNRLEPEQAEAEAINILA